MSLEELKAKQRAKNERLRKAIAVEIEDVGTYHVRPMAASDSAYLLGLKDDADPAARIGMMMAGLLCEATGERLPDKEREEWAEIFADSTWDDYVQLSAAARGVTPKADEPGN